MRILMVEDEKYLAEAIEQVLRKHNYSVDLAFDGEYPSKEMSHSGRIKGLKNIFLSGQWLQPPGGLPVALISGKDTIMRICKDEKKTFVSH